MHDMLVSTIDYAFVGHRGKLDDEGRLLVWEATISGSLNGDIEWWLVNPSPVAGLEHNGMNLAFYTARWQISADGELLLAGESAGKTVFVDGHDGVWDGHGLVTEASASLAALEGRRIHETGAVIVGADPPVSYAGRGMFSIY